MNASDERLVECRVDVAAAGQRIDLFLAARFTYLSRSAWQKEIRAGRVLLDGRPLSSPHRIIQYNECISFLGRGRSEPEVDDRWSVLYEDDQLLAVNKPGDLPVHPSGIYFRNTLTFMLERALGVPVFPLHRLDRETSGVILFSKRAADTAALAATMTGKKYLAIVKGQPPAAFECDWPLGPAWVEDERGQWHDLQGNPAPVWAVRKKRAAYAGATEAARTCFSCLAAGGRFALVEARPETGRLHQIRAHLEACGYPIVGDKLYGGDQSLFLRFIEEGLTEDLRFQLGLGRCALHAHVISVRTSAGLQQISAPLPDDMRDLLQVDGIQMNFL